MLLLTCSSVIDSHHLPSPASTPTSAVIAGQNGFQKQLLAQQPIPYVADLLAALPTPISPLFSLKGALRHEDQMLKQRLNFAHTDEPKQTAQDTANLW